MSNLNEKKANLIEKFSVPTIRRQIGDTLIFNVKTEKHIEILTELITNTTINTEDGIEKGLTKTTLDQTRTLIREFTSIYTDIDEISDEELLGLLSGGNEYFKSIANEINDIYKEFANDYYRKFRENIELATLQIEQMKTMVQFEKLKESMGLGHVSDEDLAKLNPEELNKLILQNQKKPVKKPQDRKPKAKSKAKAIKKTEQEIAKTDNEIEITQDKIDALNRYNEKYNDVTVKHANTIEEIKEIVDDIDSVNGDING
jgi:hypothetical protein